VLRIIRNLHLDSFLNTTAGGATIPRIGLAFAIMDFVPCSDDLICPMRYVALLDHQVLHMEHELLLHFPAFFNRTQDLLNLEVGD